MSKIADLNEEGNFQAIAQEVLVQLEGDSDALCDVMVAMLGLLNKEDAKWIHERFNQINTSSKG